MSIKLVVWDWNGTLFDDTRAVLQTANEIEIPTFGLPELTLTRLREVHEVPLINAYYSLGVSREDFRSKSPSFIDKFYSRYKTLSANNRTRPGVNPTLAALEKLNIDSIILSNHYLADIHSHLSRLNLSHYFSMVLANDTPGTAHHTGKKHRLESYLQANHYLPEEVLVVGDTPEETHIAQALTLQSAAISGGICSRKRLVAAKPDYVISSVKQVVNIVEELA